jgi:DNA-binding transcriptional regulator YiaG
MIAEVKTLIEKRRELGLSRSRVGQFLTIPENSLYRWEKGICSPSPLALEKVRRLLRVINELEEGGEHE